MSDTIANRDLEEAVLGAALMAGGTSGLTLTVDDFSQIKNGWVWTAIRDNERDGKPVDVMTVADKLGPRLREAGGAAYLTGLIESVPTSLNISDYADRLRKYTTRRNAIRFCETFAKEATDTSREISIEKQIERLHNISDNQTLEEEIADSVDAAIEFTELINSKNLAIPTGVPNLDHVVGGLELRKQTILAARTGRGKTAFALQLAQFFALSGHDGIYFSAEMDKASLFARRVCGITGIWWRDIMAGRVKDADIKLLEKNAMDYGIKLGRALRVDDRSKMTIDMIYRQVYKHKPKWIVVDHVGLLRHPAPTRYERLGEITWGLKEIGKEFGCGVLSLCQMSRYGQRLQDADESTEPELTDLRDSGMIEEHADNVWFLHRKKLASTTEFVKEIEIDVLVKKFRAGPANVGAKLTFDLEKQWFSPRDKLRWGGTELLERAP